MACILATKGAKGKKEYPFGFAQDDLGPVQERGDKGGENIECGIASRCCSNRLLGFGRNDGGS
jgi:hypothetical protein